ncbi:hypothetical protein HZB60_08240 [candidate division KSB1 bacterium]|nr:hypothetical protein [candidate division KSB1 bacterium]
MIARVVTLAMLSVWFAGCESQGLVLLRQADRAVDGGDFDGALLNVQTFLKRYPASPDTNQAREIQQRAGVGKRTETTDEIKEQLKAGEYEIARGMLDEVRALDFLPGNERVVMNLDSLMRQVERQLLALEQTNERMSAQFDSLSVPPPPGLTPVQPVPHVPTSAEIDSLVNESIRAALRAIPPVPKTRK